LCRFSGVPPGTGNQKLASAAARRSKMDEQELSLLLWRCDKVARGEPASDSELLKLTTRIREIEIQLGL
jgi:hypothetical protein